MPQYTAIILYITIHYDYRKTHRNYRLRHYSEHNSQSERNGKKNADNTPPHRYSGRHLQMLTIPGRTNDTPAAIRLQAAGNLSSTKATARRRNTHGFRTVLHIFAIRQI